MKQAFLVWSLAILVTVGFFLYQTETGPTYPIAYEVMVDGAKVSGELIRSGDIQEDLEQVIICPDQDVTADMVWRRFPPPSGETWRTQAFQRDGDVLRAWIPKQGMAGKIEFTVEFHKGGDTVVIPTGETAVARFKRGVSPVVLIIHIALMFFGLLISNAAGLDAIFGGLHLKAASRWTFFVLLLGGGVFGPIMQKQAFDAFWTGWPVGADWTDNKLAVSALVWLIIMIINWKAKPGFKLGRAAVVFGMLVNFAIYAIPHSLNGSTLDYETGEHIQAIIGAILLVRYR